MIPRGGACWTSLALAATALAGAAPAQGQVGPQVGGSVPSVLALSLGAPGPFVPARGGRYGGRRRGARLYTASVDVAVTATDAPTRLSLAEGEAGAPRRRGHLVRGDSVLSPALGVAAGRGRFSSLARRVPATLKLWREPLAAQRATIRLRQAFRGSARALARYHKLLLVTLTAAGP
jgi:hypothetical protein